VKLVKDKLSLVVSIVLDMANRAVTRDFEVTLEVPAADPAGMSGDQRRSALASVRRAEARLAGWKMRLVNAERDQSGEGAAEMAVREELQASKREAKRDVETATSLSGLVETWHALDRPPQRNPVLLS